MCGLTFHHFGLAVRRAQEAITFLTALGYRLGPPVFDPLQNINLIMGEHDSHPGVEIIYPGTEPGPVDKLIERHASGIIYHLCYVTENLENSLKHFEDAGLKPLCISPPKPAVLFGGRKVSFYNIKGVGLIEILE
jgi:catechol 2,3-dioxygenase-like lactoylglutathione lyase family enzyme